MNARPALRPALRCRQLGINLIELMVGMLLGLVVMGGVVGVFVANNETNKSTENLARIQENARIAFEFMSRSLREAGSNPCGTLPVITLKSGLSSATWWTGGTNFAGAIKGYENGSGFPAAAAGSGSNSIALKSDSDALTLVSGTANATQISSRTSTAFNVLSVNGYAANDIVLACNIETGNAAIFKAGAVAKAAAGNGGSIAHSLDSPLDAMTNIAQINAEAWFIGKNVRGGWSLFRTWMSGAPEEIASDVTDMQLTYLVLGENDYKSASAVATDEWANVIAVHVELKLASASEATASTPTPPRIQNAIERKIEHVITLRNRSTTP